MSADDAISARKKAQAIAEERKHPARWWFLSFATDYEFLGAAILRAFGEVTAVERATELGINPLTAPAVDPSGSLLRRAGTEV